MKIIIVISVLIGGGVAFYNANPNSLVSIAILGRLELDEHEGLKGNNRNTPIFNQYYDNYINSDKALLGIGNKELVETFHGTSNSSYKNYILEKGTVGYVATIFLIILLLYCYPSKKGFGLMFLIIASFMQRPYFLWPIESFTYISALSTFAFGKCLTPCNYNFLSNSYLNIINNGN